MYFIGLISGTSMDAIDTALADFDDSAVTLIHYQQYLLAEEIRMPLKMLSSRSPLAEISRFDVLLGRLFADAVRDILAVTDIPGDKIMAIGSHGQTIMHLEQDNHTCSVQIADPNIIAAQTGITTVADFRRMDTAAGGEGAPLAPAFHAWQFSSGGHKRGVLNIGGMANITILPGTGNTDISGFDTGPGNALLDDWIRQHQGKSMDSDGDWAAGGNTDDELLRHFLEDAYFTRPPPKSTGRDYFNPDWLNSKLTAFSRTLAAVDIQATLADLTARSVAQAITANTGKLDKLFVCGGGVHNTFLMERLKHSLPDTAISPTDELGVNPDAVEAITFAWLAKQRLEGNTGNLPSVTGALKPVILGAIYEPGNQVKCE